MTTQAESPIESPEDLLRILELQKLQQKARHTGAANRRVIFLTGALLLLMIGTFGALMLLNSLLHDMPRPETPQAEIAGAQPI